MTQPDLNISHVLAYITARYGGPPKVALALGSHLQNLGGNISFYATGDITDKQEIARESLQLFLHQTTWPKSWFRSPELLNNLIKNKSIDLLHIHEIWSWPQYAVSKMAKTRGVPYIITPHGLLETWRIKNKYFKKKLYLNLIAKNMLNNANCLHAFTPLEINGFRNAGYNGPVTVIPNGVDLSDFQNLPHPSVAEEIFPQIKGKRVILFLSRLSEEKGIDNLLHAWSEIIKRQSYNDAVLVLAGPGYKGYATTVKAMIQKLQIVSNVLLTGMVDGKNKMALISRADIYTLPSYSEGFSVSLLENMAAAKPVLITPGCNFPEVSNCGAGFCVQPDTESLIDALRKLLDFSPEQRQVMGNKARLLIQQNYTWDISARKMKTVYQCIIENKEIPLFPQPCKVEL